MTALRTLEAGPKFVYETRALLEQKQLHGLDAWIEALLQEGALPRVFSTKYPNRCLSADLLASAQEYDRYTNSTRVAEKLKLLNVEPINIETSRGWAFPPLLDCRKSWAARFGGEWIWHRDVRKSEALSHSNHSGRRLRCTPRTSPCPKWWGKADRAPTQITKSRVDQFPMASKRKQKMAPDTPAPRDYYPFCGRPQ